MKETKCEIVRRELEELKLTDECSVGATQHLRDCTDCREFYQRQTKLRQIVGSLGTVEAPPDFDFRLRARLANESPAGGFHLRSMQWSFASKGFAVAAAALLFVVGVVYFKNVVSLKQRATSEVVEQRNQPGQPAPRPVEPRPVVRDETPTVALNNTEKGPIRVKAGERRVTARARSLVAVDSSSERPIVLSNSQPHSMIFPIDASLQSFKVSLDDGRGNARTISVPTLTFGSQRLVPVATQFPPKNVW